MIIIQSAIRGGRINIGKELQSILFQVKNCSIITFV